LPRHTIVAQAAPLFPGYAFVLIELQWHAARWSPGIVRLVLDGDRPARVPDKVIAELRGREHNGIIALPKKPEPGVRFQMNERLRIRSGPLRGLFGLYAGMGPRDRIMVLMSILGAPRSIELGVGDVSQVS